MDELSFTLSSPITEEEWDMIADVDFEHTENILFHTKHGKEVEFVKRKKGKWIKIMKTNESETATFYTPTWICGDCKTEYDGAIANSIIKFCYNCGADMRGEGGDSNDRHYHLHYWDYRVYSLRNN